MAATHASPQERRRTRIWAPGNRALTTAVVAAVLVSAVVLWASLSLVPRGARPVAETASKTMRCAAGSASIQSSAA